ncbi:MAG: GNAT family N-acetyltransferase [Myxococcales bacterium]|nr:GNAT family N-acetyltransferase [Myxococcales bacterium]
MSPVLCRHDQPHLDAIAAHSVDWCGRDLDVVQWAKTPSGAEHHAWIDESGGSVIRLTPGRRARNGHTAVVDLVASPDAPTVDLLRVVTGFADQWTALERLELAVPADHAVIASALGLDFVVEVRQDDRYGGGRDGLVLGRLRPGFRPRAPAPAPSWPNRESVQPPPLPPWRFRPIEVHDAEAIRSLSVEPTVLFGTLQSPSSGVDFYADRNLKPRPGDFSGVLDIGGEVAGMGGLHPSGVGGVRILGMAVAHAWQGRGVGRHLLGMLLDAARSLATRRVELNVFEDNSRAIALYESAGFRVEGARRYDAIRAGGHATSLDMALIEPSS